MFGRVTCLYSFVCVSKWLLVFLSLCPSLKSFIIACVSLPAATSALSSLYPDIILQDTIIMSRPLVCPMHTLSAQVYFHVSNTCHVCLYFTHLNSSFNFLSLILILYIFLFPSLCNFLDLYSLWCSPALCNSPLFVFTWCFSSVPLMLLFLIPLSFRTRSLVGSSR